MNKLKYWIPSFIIAVVIFLLSSRQKIVITHKTFLDFLIFKSLHMVEYAIFFAANFRAVFNSLVKDKYKAGKIALVITVIYAIGDELHQSFVPTREGKLRDVGFDTIGALLTMLYIWKWLPKAPKKLLILARKLEFI